MVAALERQRDEDRPHPRRPDRTSRQLRGQRGAYKAFAAALAIGTGVGGFWAARSQSAAADPCSGGASQVAEVWGPEHLEVAYTLANLAMVSAVEDRMPLLERALRIFDRQLGQAHPQSLELRLATT